MQYCCFIQYFKRIDWRERMDTINRLKNKQINNKFNSTHSWDGIALTNSSQADRDNLLNVCKINQRQKRWILCVDGKDADVQQLAEYIDQSKLLLVNGQHRPIAFDKIARALLKGNCSTVILCEENFSKKQIEKLKTCAQHGNTQCILLNQASTQLH